MKEFKETQARLMRAKEMDGRKDALAETVVTQVIWRHMTKQMNAFLALLH